MTLQAEEWTIIILSLKVAALATVMCLPISIFLAWLLARKDFWGKSLLNSIIHMPLILPPVVTGYVLLLSFGKNGWIGQALFQIFGFTFAFRWTGAALAASLMALPLMVRALRLSIESFDPRLEGAAATLGAAPARVFFTITLPMAAPGLAAGVILAFVKALGEFGATITFVSNIPNETQTLSLAIYSLLQTPNGDAAAQKLIIISITLAFAALLGSELIERHLKRRIHGQP